MSKASVSGGMLKKWRKSVDLMVMPDRKFAVNEEPGAEQVVLELAAKHEPFRRALLIYRSLDHDWANLRRVLDAMRNGDGGLPALKAKNFVLANDIENFEATADSHNAIGLDSRHGIAEPGVSEGWMTLEEAEEMFLKLFEVWIKDLKQEGLHRGAD
jgi:hypothetical protein